VAKTLARCAKREPRPAYGERPYAIAARDNTTGRPGPRSKTAKATTK
jgi:hypothetical protein